MRKVLKVIGVIVLLTIALIAGILFALAIISEYRADHYYEHAVTGGSLEKQYSAMGSYDVSHAEFNARTANYGKYAVWYPSELESGTNRFPIVLWANGNRDDLVQLHDISYTSIILGIRCGWK